MCPGGALPYLQGNIYAMKEKQIKKDFSGPGISLNNPSLRSPALIYFIRGRFLVKKRAFSENVGFGKAKCRNLLVAFLLTVAEDNC
jgi:hypothetical protein